MLKAMRQTKLDNYPVANGVFNKVAPSFEWPQATRFTLMGTGASFAQDKSMLQFTIPVQVQRRNEVE